MEKQKIDRILFSVVGDTDPMRSFHDGPMLHIARYYKPNLVVLFLSAEMVEREAENGRYTESIRLLDPQCECRLIKTDIKDPNKLDGLVQIAQEYMKVQSEFPDAEMFVNLTSGTPQMQMVAAFLAKDFNARGIQVDTPAKKSNLHTDRNKETTPIEEEFELNGDNEPDSPNRCSEPRMRLMQRYVYRNQILSLIEQYEYRGALRIVESNRELFDPNLEKLLQHAICRANLCYTEAKAHIDKYGTNMLVVADTKVLRAQEYLMLIRLRQERQELAEMIVKVSPFLFEMVKYHLTENRRIDFNTFCSGKTEKVSRADLGAHYPALLKALDTVYKGPKGQAGFRDGTDLSFPICRIMLDALGRAEDAALMTLLDDMQTLVTKFRNDVAHVMIGISEDELKSKGFTSKKVVSDLEQIFSIITEGKKKANGFTFSTLNRYITDCLEKSLDLTFD